MEGARTHLGCGLPEARYCTTMTVLMRSGASCGPVIVMPDASRCNARVACVPFASAAVFTWSSLPAT
jgi:hypothetical protein